MTFERSMDIKSLDEDMELSCDLRQFSDYHIAEHVVLTNPDMKAVNTEENPWNVIPKAGSGVWIECGKLCGKLGKHSWNMIRLQKGTR